MNLKSRLVSAGALGALLVGGVYAVQGGGDYKVSVLLPTATKIVSGGPVLVNGFQAGKVTGISVEGGKARVEFSLKREFAPLHDGASVDVAWKAVLSERNLEVHDGPVKNSRIPDGGVVRGTSARDVEVDDILSALDAPTRKQLQGVLARVDSTLAGHQEDLRGTLSTAGPALDALGQILRAMGTDGPAMRNLVVRLNDMLGTLAAHDDAVQRIVGNVGDLTGRVAANRSALKASLAELPATFKQARTTLDLVPSVVDEAVPLLNDLAPATRRLQPVASNLSPLLEDLGPVTAQLRPTLAMTNQLLGQTPSLLDSTHATFPALGKTVSGLREPLAFMRPYTPEMTAMLTNWGSAFSNYDSDGYFARIFAQAGPTSLNENPGIVPPGVSNDQYPAPGAIVSQPWTDAYGSDMR